MASNSAETNTTTTTMRLKLMVDVKANKVVFAEAGKDFVDFIFHLMTLPLAAISKLMINTQPMQVESCNLGTLYHSVDSIDPDCFHPNHTKKSILSPKIAIALPFFSFFDFPTAILPVYKCDYYFDCTGICNCVTDCAGTICPRCPDTMKILKESNYTYVRPSTSNMLAYTTTKYVRGGAAYVVTDNMEVKPISSISYVKSLVKDFDSLQEQQVEVGPQQGLAIVKALLENRDVLTSVFLQKKVKEEAIN